MVHIHFLILTYKLLSCRLIPFFWWTNDCIYFNTHSRFTCWLNHNQELVPLSEWLIQYGECPSLDTCPFSILENKNLSVSLHSVTKKAGRDIASHHLLLPALSWVYMLVHSKPPGWWGWRWWDWLLGLDASSLLPAGGSSGYVLPSDGSGTQPGLKRISVETEI